MSNLKRSLALFYLIGLFGLSFLLRMYNITAPLADWHSFRQADTVSVAREYVKHGIDLLRPRYHDLSNIQSGKDNLEGYRMVEMPLVSGLVAATYLGPISENFELHVWYRIVTALFSAGSAVLLCCLIARVTESDRIGLIAGLMYSILPYSVYYGRATLPESPAVFFSLLSAWLLVLSNEGSRWRWFLLSAFSGALALLVKPPAIFILVAHLGLLLSGKHWRSLFHVKWIPYSLILVIPLFLWRQWITQFPEGIPAAAWLLNGNGIRFTGAFFRWIFDERIGQMILGTWGVFFLFYGFVVIKRSYGYIIGLVTGALLYVVIFASGNVQHDYYQVLVLPALCAVSAIGIERSLFGNRGWFGKSITVVVLGFSLAFSWYTVRGFFGINNPAIVAAGAAVDRLTPADALVIAPYMGDTAFLYQTNRRGWPIGYEIEDKISMGAQFYVSTAYDDEARALESKYSLVEKTDDYILINLISEE